MTTLQPRVGLLNRSRTSPATTAASSRVTSANSNPSNVPLTSSITPKAGPGPSTAAARRKVKGSKKELEWVTIVDGDGEDVRRLNDILNDLIDVIISNYITTWYPFISPYDRSFIPLVRRLITDLLRTLSGRIIDPKTGTRDRLVTLSLEALPEVLQKHWRVWEEAERAVAELGEDVDAEELAAEENGVEEGDGNLTLGDVSFESVEDPEVKIRRREREKRRKAVSAAFLRSRPHPALLTPPSSPPTSPPSTDATPLNTPRPSPLNPAYLPSLVSPLLTLGLPPPTASSPVTFSIVREILGNAVLGGAVRRLSEPWMLWKIGLSILGEPKTSAAAMEEGEGGVEAVREVLALVDPLGATSLETKKSLASSLAQGQLGATLPPAPLSSSPTAKSDVKAPPTTDDIPGMRKTAFAIAFLVWNLIWVGLNAVSASFVAINKVSQRISSDWAAVKAWEQARVVGYDVGGEKAGGDGAEREQGEVRSGEEHEEVLKPWMELLATMLRVDGPGGGGRSGQAAWRVLEMVVAAGGWPADRLLPYYLCTRVLTARTAATAIAKLQTSLFPNGKLAPVIPDPTEEEQEDMRARLERRLMEKVPGPLAATLLGKTLAERRRSISTLLDPLSDSAANIHLFVSFLEVAFLALLPELAEEAPASERDMALE